jgi:hypothetical protein
VDTGFADSIPTTSCLEAFFGQGGIWFGLAAGVTR